MLERLQEIKERYDEISHLLADPDLPKDRERYTQLTKEHAGLEEYMGPYKRLMELEEEISAHDAMRDDPDPEMRELVRDELERLRAEKAELEQAIRALFIPKDPNDDKDVILEIRAGTGGEEAALFAADLFRMYARYAERRGWKVEIESANPGEHGGYKEIIARIEGRGAHAHILAVHEELDDCDFHANPVSAAQLRALQDAYASARESAVTRVRINMSLAIRNAFDVAYDLRQPLAA